MTEKPLFKLAFTAKEMYLMKEIYKSTVPCVVGQVPACFFVILLTLSSEGCWFQPEATIKSATDATGFTS